MDSELMRFVWAKSEPRKSLECHLYETAIVVKVLLKDSIFAGMLPNLAQWLGLSEEETVRLAQYLAGTHDLGKAHPLYADNKLVGFAKDFFELHPDLKYPYSVKHYRHERGSAEIVARIWKRDGLFDLDLWDCFADILKLHHQGKSGEKAVSDFNEEWVDVQDSIERRIRERFPPPSIEFDQLQHVDAACTVLTALLILADWLASSSPFAENAEPIPEALLTEQISSFLHRIGLDKCESIDGTRMTELFVWMKEDSLRPLQKAVEDALTSRAEMPLLTILEAPMGEGKTEAGLYVAVQMARYWRKSGLYVALPTAATSNQMYKRVNVFLKEHRISEVHLLHGMAWLNEETEKALTQSEGSDSADGLENWLKPTRRALLSPWAVGTVDQALLSVLHVKYGVLRLLGLANKVLVIDEVHAYDAYMSDIILRLLEWCKVLCIPVVMLSATLPSEKKRAFLEVYDKIADKLELTAGYPLITLAFGDGSMKQIPVDGSEQRNRVTVSCRSFPDDITVADLVLQTVDQGGCLCFLVNTVSRAQALYQAIKHQDPGCQIYLFHSRFSAARRSEIENECIRLFGKGSPDRPKKAILVATQVVEQSLDLDFDAMITELAPIDLLLQRIGRLHRHKTTPRPDSLRYPAATVLIPPSDKYGASGLIYYEVYLKRTHDLLIEHPVVSIPDDIPGMVDRVYGGTMKDEKEAEIWLKQQYGDEFKAAQAETVELKLPDKEDFLLPQNDLLFGDDENSWIAAKTRLGEDTVRLALLPPSLFETVRSHMADGKKIPSPLAKQVMMYSVSIRLKTWNEFTKGQTTEPYLEGDGKLYGMKMMCAINEADPCETLETSIGSNRLVLDHELGFITEKEGTQK